MKEEKGQPACFAVLWEISAPECGGCFIRKECERATKRHESGVAPAAPEPTTPEPEEPEELEPIDPLEHLLLGLAGKFNRQDRIGDKAVGHYFEENGKTVVLVTVSKMSSRVRIQAKNFERIFDGIGSVEQAEEVLKAVTA